MHKTTTLAGIALLAACLMLAAPSASQAQGHRHGGTAPAGYDRGGHGRDSGYGRGGSDYRRPAVVHPESRHWTPSSGLHTHGHTHVPHRGHSHTRPY